MLKEVTIPPPVSDVDIEMQGGKPFTMEWAVFLRAHILSWTGFDESTDAIKVAESIKNKFIGKGVGQKIVLSQNEWEQGCKALKEAHIDPIFRAALRPHRLAWMAAADAKTEEPASDRGDPTPVKVVEN